MTIFDPYTPDEIMENAVAGCGLKFLKPEQIFMLDEALASVGDYGEVRLVINKGRLRFVIMEKSYDANKWRREEGFHENKEV